MFPENAFMWAGVDTDITPDYLIPFPPIGAKGGGE